MSMLKNIRRAIQVLNEIGQQRNAENPAVPISQKELAEIISGPQSTAGTYVNSETAMKVTAVLACVRLLAGTYASLSSFVYERLDPKGKRRATEHPIYSLIHDRPNPHMSAFTFKEWFLKDVLLRGNGYAEIEWGRDGYPKNIWPLIGVTVETTGSIYNLKYKVIFHEGKRDKTVYYLDPLQVLHVQAISCGIKGKSLINYSTEAIGGALAVSEYANRFFSGGARPGGVLEHPKNLTEDGAKRLRKQWEIAHSGLSNTHRVAVLEEGMKWHETAVSPEDAQALEARKFSVADIARIFLVPPHLIGDVERSTSWGTGLEQQNLGYLIYSLRPWLVKIEQEFNYKLFLTAEERRKYYIENLVDSLLRGDIKARNEAYQIQRQNGIINADEWREFENMNPLPDGRGTAYLVPLNMGLAGADGKVISVTQEEPSQKRSIERREEDGLDEKVEARREIEHSFRPIFSDVAGRTVRREVKAIREQIKKTDYATDAEAFRTWLRKYYEEENIGWIREYFSSAFDGLFTAVSRQASREVSYPNPEAESVEKFTDSYKSVFATRYAAESRGRLEADINKAEEKNADYTKTVESRLRKWEEERPEDIARDEVNRASNGVSKAVWIASGILTLIWNSHGDSCPACKALNGKVVGINGSFVTAGEKMQFEDQLLTVNTNITHPPLHRGCDCHLKPGGY